MSINTYIKKESVFATDILPLAITFIVPFVIAFFWYWIVGYRESSQCIEQLTVSLAIEKAFTATLATISAFILTITVAFYKLKEDHKLKLETLIKDNSEKQEKLITAYKGELEGYLKSSDEKQTALRKEVVEQTNNIQNNVDKYLNKAKIIFESGINEFNDDHLLALHNVLKSLEEKTKAESVELFAIDNTDPRTWWSDTMTGYLALLAKWKSNDTTDYRRSINRIFVCKKNELLSPVFVKTISLHSLMGFKTYVIDLDSYNKIYDEYLVENNVDSSQLKFNKELLLWAKMNSENKYEPIELSFQLDKLGKKKNWNHVKCYQSFWKVGEDYNRRIELENKSNNYKLENYYGVVEKDSNKIDIWFEFIAKKDSGVTEKQEIIWNNLPAHYYALIQKIISKTECCHDVNKVIKMSAYNLGIEIKTSASYTDEDSDYVATSDIKEILEKYYSKLINQ